MSMPGRLRKKRHRLAVPVERAAVEGVFLLDHARDAIGLARQPFLLFLEVIDKAQQLFLLVFLRRQRPPWRVSSSCDSDIELLLGLRHDGGQVAPRLAFLAAIDHAVVEAALAVELGLLETALRCRASRSRPRAA